MCADCGGASAGEAADGHFERGARFAAGDDEASVLFVLAPLAQVPVALVVEVVGAWDRFAPACGRVSEAAEAARCGEVKVAIEEVEGDLDVLGRRVKRLAAEEVGDEALDEVVDSLAADEMEVSGRSFARMASKISLARRMSCSRRRLLTLGVPERKRNGT